MGFSKAFPRCSSYNVIVDSPYHSNAEKANQGKAEEAPPNSNNNHS